ncbi:predicted protein [Nematostella vectensis]|uniref:Uncharacterized protein n=1 Tax=Nematostella vectensis TaxID=45351 RepID=A7SLF5_NEMVE|nr:predicted protein [Nematostella vectensis]|eukprot:XP_001627609.1 predicted protein [Nematostella vectensis]
MKHYVKPTPERNPTRIIIHVGTNDLRSLSPVQVADGIVDLAREIESTSTGTKVVISELVTRRDSFRDGVQEVNKRLKRFCSQNRWDRISHTNITPSMLNQGGLHLNARIISADDNAIYCPLPRQRGFKLAALNINKLTTHIDELRILLDENPIDILAINETKLDDNDNEVHLSGYEKIIRRDRTSGGGVCFYIRSGINYKLRLDLNILDLENLCIDINKPRSTPFLTIIHGSTQLIKEATRITENTATLLDVIYTNHPDRIACSGVSHVGISDHSLVYAYRKLSIGPPNKGHSTIIYRKLKNFNYDAFRADIASLNWNFLNSYNDPNVMWNNWKEMFLHFVEKHAPFCAKRVRLSKSPWINSDLKKLMHQRVVFKIKAIRSKDVNDWKIFKKYRNFVNCQIKIAKQIYYDNAFRENEGNIRNTWKVINELTSRKTNNSTIKEVKLDDDHSITDSLSLSEAFNSHFATIGPNLANNIAASSDLSHLNFLTRAANNNYFNLTVTS